MNGSRPVCALAGGCVLAEASGGREGDAEGRLDRSVRPWAGRAKRREMIFFEKKVKKNWLISELSLSLQVKTLFPLRPKSDAKIYGLN